MGEKTGGAAREEGRRGEKCECVKEGERGV